MTQDPILTPGAEDLFLEAMAYLDNKYVDSKRFNDLYELAIVMFHALYGKVPAEVPQYADKVGRAKPKMPSLLPIASVKCKPFKPLSIHRDYTRADKAIDEAKQYFNKMLGKNADTGIPATDK